MFRSDLASELLEGKTYPGIESEKITREPLTTTTIKIQSDEGANALGKPKGTYITEEWKQNLYFDNQLMEEAAKLASQSLKKLLSMSDCKHVLVVGLGNRHITPDALGPRVAERVLVTRHIQQGAPALLDDRFRTVSAIAPGVMGVTGVETAEIVRGVVQRIRPDVVICIDALASRRTQRLGTTLQMSDTGIQPGAGLGNPRAALDYKTLRVPVVALGVPLVVYAETISRDAAEAYVASQGQDKKLPDLPDEVAEIARSEFGELVVTPKEIDHMVEEISMLVADTINLAMHPTVSLHELRGMLV